MAKDLKERDYEHLGRAIEEVVASGYTSKHRLIAANFLRGIFFGLGATIGVSIVLAIIVWVSTPFKNLPVVGGFFQRVENSITDAQQQ